MTSYTIDPSVFIPPEIPNDNNFKKENLEKLKKYFIIIKKCYEFIKQEGISVYIFHGYGNDFNDVYMKEANKYGLPADLFKKRLDNILIYNIPELHYGDRIGPRKYYFQNWFRIKNLVFKKSSYKPLLQYKQLDTSKFLERINYIGILNKYIYKNSFFHILVVNDRIDHFMIESKQLSFILYEKSYSNENMDVKLQTESIDDIALNIGQKYNTVLEAYNKAKVNFSDYIVFGKDVEIGITTIRDLAGPPNRIYAYLETLKDFCIYKRNNNTNFDDEYILQSLGCICSYEDSELWENEEAKIQRFFDNGNDQKILFDLHLKPNTFNQIEDLEKRKRTVRIYIFWDDSQKKVIVGWIGKHL
jgi:hypothetical protein